MTEQEKRYFEKLTEDRSDSAKTLEKPSMRGVKRSVVEKYSDQAHFIYELLQNADDAGATSARFVLHRDKLIFAHNGTRHFSVTNPETEDIDSQNGNLGDINAITSIANSNKTESSIGKFGVGFKAVFQYTSTPHIYGPNFKFKIERFIVPVMLDSDCEYRKQDETLFVFPFDHDERSCSEAYEDISDKLRSLSYPILFLTHLKDISFEIDSVFGLYGKECVKTKAFGSTVGEKLCLTHNNGDELCDETLWLFTRADASGRKYSVGFFLDENGLLRAVKNPAYCFFPTKEITNLKFLVHAPFLLTDSREGIKAGEAHNKKMIEYLSELSADSLMYLKEIGEAENKRIITDEIIEIIPVDESVFNDVNDKAKISFKPFYTAIKSKFEKEALIPTESGYTTAGNAYWAFVPQLAEVFTTKQLALLSKNKNAQWVFRSFGRQDTLRRNKALCSYIDDITKTWLDEEKLLNGWNDDRSYYRLGGMSKEFIEAQSFEWLNSFYAWLSETEKRTKGILDKPIFLDQNGHAVPAYDSRKQAVLFLPREGMENYKTVNAHLLSSDSTKAFLQKIGVKEPSVKDQIYNVILPQYKDGAEIDTAPHFKLFYEYYNKCPQAEIESFVSLIRGCEFVVWYNCGREERYRGKASELYFPSEELLEYFSSKPDTKFIDFQEYLDVLPDEPEENIMAFFARLGVSSEARIIEYQYNSYEARIAGLPQPHSTSQQVWTETRLDGCKEIIDDIITTQSVEKSKILWMGLLSLSSKNVKRLDRVLSGKCKYFYYSSKIETFESSDIVSLRDKAWILRNDGIFSSASQLDINSMDDMYLVDGDDAKSLLEALGISKENILKRDIDETLSDEQKRKIELANKIAASGLSEEEILEMISQRVNAKKVSEPEGENEEGDSGGVKSPARTSGIGQTEDGTATGVEEDWEASPEVKSVVKEITSRPKAPPKPVRETENADEDEYTLPALDYSEQIEKAKEKSALEIEKIVHLEQLQRQIEESEKYSFGWFRSLMELEAISHGASESGSKEISISFANVEKEAGSERTLILKHPSGNIPQFMEDLSDIPLILHYGNEIKSVAVEVTGVKAYTLRVKLKKGADIGGIDLSQVTEAKIEAQSPMFLLDELRKQFLELGFEDEYNLRDNLCENIEFVFGPPGTGKTTHLVNNVLLPIVKNKPNAKVLVLTPTNKAADVLVNKISESMGADTSYYEWLVRFGVTGDEKIEQSPVFKEKMFDIRKMAKHVTVTTIARFPYDYFITEPGKHLYLHSMQWDYIVIDEASMIPIGNIIYPLYKQHPEKFVIAGDPFQIEPITSVKAWKDENIYKMVQLESFTDPKTVPHQYSVELLTTQYRSVPEIGEVFSKFTYGGVLRHHRTAESQQKYQFGALPNVSTLNIIKFPVTKYESIYRPKRLQGKTPYQIYSALFVRELTAYLAQNISKQISGHICKIGIVAAYRAQADLIEKLIRSADIPKNIEILVGTIHGFQGDECDIVFAVFNPPPAISSSPEMFLNRQNIINVSVSRARDYLFIVMPDDQTENVANLRLVKQIEGLFKKNGKYSEYRSHDIETLIFGTPKYLEENSFTTSHQSVNVYGLPNRRYEIRSEETAIDVQIHGGNPDVSATVAEDKHEPAETVPVPVQKTDERKTADLPVAEFTWLNSNRRWCPKDSSVLETIPVQIYRKDGTSKTISMLYCAKCGKKYLLKENWPKNLSISECLVKAVDPEPPKPANKPTHNSSPAPGSKERIPNSWENLVGKRVSITPTIGARSEGIVRKQVSGIIYIEITSGPDKGREKKYSISPGQKFVRVIDG